MATKLQLTSERQEAANELEAIIFEMRELVGEFSEKLAVVLGNPEIAEVLGRKGGAQ